MTQDNSSGHGQNGGCGCGSIPRSRPVINDVSDLHSHVRDVSEFSDVAQHRSGAIGQQEQNSGCGSTTLRPVINEVYHLHSSPDRRKSADQGQRRFAQVISRRLTAARAGDEQSWRWIELLLQGSGLGGGPSFPACDGTITDELAAILSKTSVSGCTDHQPSCRVFFFNPSREGDTPLEYNGSCIPYVSNNDGYTTAS